MGRAGDEREEEGKGGDGRAGEGTARGGDGGEGRGGDGRGGEGRSLSNNWFMLSVCVSSYGCTREV